MRSDADGEDRTAPDQHVMRAGYALDADDGCIADARHHAIAFLDQAHTEHYLLVPDRARDLTQLVVSELVTNALRYAPGPVLMELRITARVVEVVVWDSDPTVPTALPADPGRIGQHGLEIVKAVTEDLLIEPEPSANASLPASPCPTPPATPPRAGRRHSPALAVLPRGCRLSARRRGRCHRDGVLAAAGPGSAHQWLHCLGAVMRR